MSEPLCAALREKILEQLELTEHLLRLLPEGCGSAQPVRGAWPVDILSGHLLEASAGVCAVLAAAEPARLAHFGALRRLAVNHECAAAEALERLAIYRRHIEEGFSALLDADLSRAIPTLFVPEGEPLLTLLLGNLEHLANHKHQMFTYLKLLGVVVGTRDLYRFRGRRGPAARAEQNETV